MSEEEPCLFLSIGEVGYLVSEHVSLLFIIQNKKRKLSWREAADSEVNNTSSEIGQLMWYLVAAHFKRFSISRIVPAPVLGLYIKDMKVSVYTADLTLSVFIL